MSRLGDQLRKARLDSKMSEKALAKKIGASEKFIKEVESGKKVINEQMIDKISKILGKNLNDISLDFEDEAPTDRVPVNRAKKVESPNVALGKVQDVWNDAFSSVLKSVPIYDYSLNNILGKKQLPVESNKIEGHAKDKVLYLKVLDDDMIGFRINKNDIAFGVITNQIFNNSICLIQKGNERYIRQIKKLNNNQILLVSNKGSLRTETVTDKEIQVLVKLERLEISLI
ncbi:S24 family peptidase [Clostridium sp. DL1XJH146]